MDFMGFGLGNDDGGAQDFQNKSHITIPHGCVVQVNLVVSSGALFDFVRILLCVTLCRSANRESLCRSLALAFSLSWKYYLH